MSNNLSLIEGILTNDPESDYSVDGSTRCIFEVAVNFKFKVGEKDIEDVVLITALTWNKVAEACLKYLEKNSNVRVRGLLKEDTWTTKEGTKRNKIYIEASAVDFLSNRENK